LICINLAAGLHHSLKGVSSLMLGFTCHGNQAGPGPNGRTEWGAGASPMKLILKSLALTLLAYLLPLAVLILGGAGLLTPHEGRITDLISQAVAPGYPNKVFW
jgi:hypothetical protein